MHSAATAANTTSQKTKSQTRTLPVDVRKIGKLNAVPHPDDILDAFDIEIDPESKDAAHIQQAAEQLRHSEIPVAFPTETVYGLGADATRSQAVRGIYKAKQRPADNPLIVHFASLQQLRDCLHPEEKWTGHTNGQLTCNDRSDPIPDIYKPLISRFWPGPLTILLPNPPNSRLAPEVTAGLKTFGARMPRHVLALALIKLAYVPVAAPSANASTKPSPTAAEHVAYDLDGRIDTIIDGGPCDVGVESTVVDGLSSPPVILRPGGISMEQLRACPGWEHTQIGYKNVAEAEAQPKAPGMKYRHYSPKATVILCEAGKAPPSLQNLQQFIGTSRRLGVITTKRWEIKAASAPEIIQRGAAEKGDSVSASLSEYSHGFQGMLKTLHHAADTRSSLRSHEVSLGQGTLQLLEIPLGRSTSAIAKGIFSALRELDRENVDAIVVEGIDEDEGDTAAAVMNRLRKAAEINIGQT